MKLLFPVFVFSSLCSSHTATANNERKGPINTIATMTGADWDDRIGLQQKWSNDDKGWKVDVEWRSTPFGAGLFAAQDIPAETVLRVGKNGENLMEFKDLIGIEHFLADPSVDDDAYMARLRYLKDYLWGFNPRADERGYEIPGQQRTTARPTPRFFGMWIPGNGLNHSERPNTVYRPAAGGTDEGINLVALRDITKGEELYDDYRRHGLAPEWLLDFAKEHEVSLNFADCNDFVEKNRRNEL